MSVAAKRMYLVLGVMFLWFGAAAALVAETFWLFVIVVIGYLLLVIGVELSNRSLNRLDEKEEAEWRSRS